jgi:nucleoside-diphosphate-sugar epimerase
MTSYLILGGSGYIGFKWAERLAARGRVGEIILADTRPPQTPLPPGARFVLCDVRKPLAPQLGALRPEWIFNFAAVHREPGHAREEYFDTNLPGARHVCAYATATGCPNILFTSSIAVYGPTAGATSEASPKYPTTPYGISKLGAELIQEGWQGAQPGRRLIVCRPGVVYGPGDPGNILRMIRAVKKGIFVFPGSKQLRKSYAYIEGLLDSFEFTLARAEGQLTYNYVEQETEPLGRLVELVQQQLGKKVPTFTAPLFLLTSAAFAVQVLTGGRSAIHPARVRKAATATHIVPQQLQDWGFVFRYDFAASLRDWAKKSPQDFR